MQKEIIIIGGATASGKSAAALSMVHNNYGGNGLIINGDSMQVYHQLPILTAQPSAEECGNVEHKLYGFIDVAQSFSVGKWLDHVRQEIDRAFELDKVPIIVGGTGMYLNSLVNGVSKIPDISDDVRNRARAMLSELGNQRFHEILTKCDPEMASRLHAGDSQRVTRALEIFMETGRSLAVWQSEPNQIFYPANQFKQYIVNRSRDDLYDRCNKRFLQMIEQGAIDEVSAICGCKLSVSSSKILGVQQLLAFINGDIDLDDAISKAQQLTRNYAKRQLTWFRNRDGFQDISVVL